MADQTSFFPKSCSSSPACPSPTCTMKPTPSSSKGSKQIVSTFSLPILILILILTLTPHRNGPILQKHNLLPILPLPLDKALLAEMEAANAAELQMLDERLPEAEKQEGESEISDALKARVNYLTRIRDKQLALKKTPGLGSRIDITLTIVRIGFFFNDNKIITSNMADAEKRRLGLAQPPQSVPGHAPHLDLPVPARRRAPPRRLSTFTASELMSFNDFVALTVIAGALHLGRVDLDKRQPLNKHTSCPHARSPHKHEMRVRAYAQLLESYECLTLESLSAAFGVSVGFVDADLSHFISLSRLACKIDKAHSLVRSTRPSLKNAQYEVLVKRGDVQLGGVQRLSKVVY
ncbi:hypothetical protein CVT25_006941 [Psilocybe cyanescens]|uniref:PCI domain-containing protein n=1 Tax=Psilocybe cyanescens TaxID=93625 RepID=A0A409WYJ2_PSICY|nr:hypothetical protein CVT25_006941 [Psilocybe cyanescens]